MTPAPRTSSAVVWRWANGQGIMAPSPAPLLVRSRENDREIRHSHEERENGMAEAAMDVVAHSLLGHAASVITIAEKLDELRGEARDEIFGGSVSPDPVAENDPRRSWDLNFSGGAADAGQQYPEARQDKNHDGPAPFGW